MKSFRSAGGLSVARMALALPLILLSLAAWLVLVAGISLVRHETGTDNAIFTGAYTVPSLSYTWFVMSANFVVLFLALIYLVGSRLPFIGGAYSGIVGLLAVVTTLDVLETREWETTRQGAHPYTSKLDKGVVTVFSAYVALSTLNALVILILGHASHVRRDADTYAGTHVHSNPVGTAAPPAHAPAPATYAAV